MRFHSLMNEVTGAECEVLISEDWAQGRSTFGGLVGAFVLQTMQKKVGTDRQLLDFNASFIAPVSPTALRIKVTVLRAGAVSQVQGQALQDGEVDS